MLERQAGAQQAADHVGHRHHQREMPPDMALPGKQHDRRQVGRGVQQLGAGAGMQEVEAQPAHEQEDEEAAGAGSEEPVVETDGQAQDCGRQGLAPALEAWGVVPPEVLAGQGVDQHAQQDDRQQAAQEVR